MLRRRCESIKMSVVSVRALKLFYMGRQSLVLEFVMARHVCGSLRTRFYYSVAKRSVYEHLRECDATNVRTYHDCGEPRVFEEQILGESKECYVYEAGQHWKQWMIEGGDGGGWRLEARTDYDVSESGR